MILEKLEHFAMGLRVPLRVVVSVDPVEAVSPERARRQGIGYSVVYVRKDGWTIGCRREWAEETRALWAEDWIAEITLWDEGVKWLNGAGERRA